MYWNWNYISLKSDLVNGLHCKIKGHEFTDRSKASLKHNMKKKTLLTYNKLLVLLSAALFIR